MRNITVAITVDDKMGLAFNKRRQSRDSVLCSRVVELSNGSKLWMSEYSAKLFEGADIIINNGFLYMAEAGDYCFVEESLLNFDFSAVENIIVYRWNRKYPADVKLDLTVLEGFKLVDSCEFKGSSHEKITEEIYKL